MEREFGEFERICLNCCYFFQDTNDVHWGICINDEAFQPFMDGITENGDFSNCRELYQKKRYNGEIEACDQFEEPEVLDIPDGMDFKSWLWIEQMEHANVEEVVRFLYDPDQELVERAISIISTYVRIGNKDAYEGFLEYYLSLGPAESLKDVHSRIEIVEILSSCESDQRTIKAYVHELARTPSNNTTRQLYYVILKRLNHCSADLVQKLLLDLLNKRKYGSRMESRILETMNLAFGRESREEWFKIFRDDPW